MNNLRVFLVTLMIFSLFKSGFSNGTSSNELLKEEIAKVRKIFIYHLSPHTNDITSYIKEIVLLDEDLQKKIISSIAEALGNPKAQAKRAVNEEVTQQENKPAQELQAPIHICQYNSTALDPLIIETELFIFRLKEEKIKLKKSYLGFKKAEEIVNDERTKEKTKSDNETYEIVKDYFNKKSRYYKLLFKRVVEASDMATVAYKHLVVASKILQNFSNDTPLEKQQDFIDIEKAMANITKVEIFPVQIVTFKTNSLFIAANSITKYKQDDSKVKPPFYRSPIIPILSQVMIKLAQPLNRDANSELGAMVDMVLSTFEQSFERDDKYDMKAVKAPKLGSKLRNFGKKFRKVIKTEYDNLPNYAETTAPLTDQQIYCRSDDDEL